ncbi:MAG: hypothetical protein IJB75_01920 [Oscillospiraceae bacterium]|nr:hypothetical protein [Oscillospiraceae bacterium]
MKKQIWLPALAWVGGIAGFALRRWEWNTAYDSVTRLMSTTLAGGLLTALMIVLAVAFILGCRGVGRRSAADWFYAPSGGYAMAALSGALVMLLGGGFGLRQLYAGGERNMMSLAAFLLLIVGGATAAVLAREIYRGIWSAKATPIMLMLPSFGALFWLVCVYQQHARQPEVQLYAWQLLSAVAIVLALYGQVTLSLDKGGAGRTCVYGLLAIALTPAALADGADFAHSLVWLGSAVWLTAQSYMLLNAAFGPERPERMCPPEEAEQPEEETELEDTDNGQ